MGLDAIGLITQNMQRSQEFYRLLGLEFQALGGEDHWEAVCPNGLRLMLDSADLAKKLNPQWQPATGHGVVLCFQQVTPQAVDETFHKVTQAGFSGLTAPWDAFWGQRYASVLDNDGNQIDLFAPLAY